MEVHHSRLLKCLEKIVLVGCGWNQKRFRGYLKKYDFFEDAEDIPKLLEESYNLTHIGHNEK